MPLSTGQAIIINDLDLLFQRSVDVVSLLSSHIKRVTGNNDDHSVISAESWFRTEIMKDFDSRKQHGDIENWRPSVGKWILDRNGERKSKTYDLWFQAEEEVFIELKTFGRGGIERATAIKDLHALTQIRTGNKGWFIALGYPHHEHELERWDNQINLWLEEYSGKSLLNRNIAFNVNGAEWFMKVFIIEVSGQNQE